MDHWAMHATRQVGRGYEPNSADRMHAIGNECPFCRIPPPRGAKVLAGDVCNTTTFGKSRHQGGAGQPQERALAGRRWNAPPVPTSPTPRGRLHVGQSARRMVRSKALGACLTARRGGGNDNHVANEGAL
jgi:hypothetical protein